MNRDVFTELSDLRILVAKLSEQNAALRAMLADTYQPCVEDVDMKNIDGDVEFHTMYCGTALFIGDGDCAHLPDGYVICKRVQP